jgi:hypothetical protein
MVFYCIRELVSIAYEHIYLYLGGTFVGPKFTLYSLQVFGRGGEEMDFLQQQGIRVEVIPGMINPLWNLDDLQCWLILVMNCLDQTSAGITSASGIASELGIPLTHRGVATR